jgi:small GTP-binding protein
MKFPNQEKDTKVMFCSILNVSREYLGIKDVNCYILYIDLESEKSKSKFELILNYAMEYFDFSKKLYVYGLLDKTKGKTKINKEDIIEYVEELYIPYEYKEINIKEIKEICDSFTEIFNYSLLHPINRKIINKVIKKEKKEIKEQSEKHKVDEKEEPQKIYGEFGNTPLKVVLLGESGVGKSSIISRFINGIFEDNIPNTSGATYVSKIMEFPKFQNKTITFDIWDTAGQTKYRDLSKFFFIDAKVIILVYDITNKKSFDEIIDHWMPQINSLATKNPSKFVYINYYF